jgi:uncharacterized phage-associated protein
MKGVFIVVNVSDLADYLLYLDKEESKLDGEDAAPDITPLKLQKLLYYCQGYSLGLFGEPLFEESIEAWKHGPVVKSIYNKYSSLHGSCIPFEKKEPEIDERAKKIAQLVMQDKGRFPATALRNTTHGEKPWSYTYNKIGQDGIIKEDLIKEFFSLLFDEELSFEEEKAMFLAAGTSPTQKEWEEINKYVASL